MNRWVNWILTMKPPPSLLPLFGENNWIKFWNNFALSQTHFHTLPVIHGRCTLNLLPFFMQIILIASHMDKVILLRCQIFGLLNVQLNFMIFEWNKKMPSIWKQNLVEDNENLKIKRKKLKKKQIDWKFWVEKNSFWKWLNSWRRCQRK